MEKEKGSKPKNTKLLAILIAILAGFGVILITLSLLFGFRILGIMKIASSSGESEAEEETASAGEIAAATLISVEEVYGIITKGEDYFILDVRNQDEYDEAHIEGVTLIPVDMLESRLSELPGDLPIIVYCKAGGRSAAAAEILVNNGFTEVYDMGGGITEWIDKGYPTVSEE